MCTGAWQPTVSGLSAAVSALTPSPSSPCTAERGRGGHYCTTREGRACKNTTPRRKSVWVRNRTLFPTNNKIVVGPFPYFFRTYDVGMMPWRRPGGEDVGLHSARTAGSELHLAHDVHGRPCWPARRQVCQCCLNGTAVFKWPLLQRAASEVR